MICLIYIGNILSEGKGMQRLLHHLGDDAEITSTMERQFDEAKCVSLSRVLESYIRMLLTLYPSTHTSKGTSPMIENIKRYITSNPCGDITLGELAGIFHYNEKYLGRLFKRETGKTLHEYINEKRVREAEKLLLSTNESIINVSERVGFNNVTYFNRIFKSIHKKSPVAYRKDVQQYPEYQS